MTIKLSFEYKQLFYSQKTRKLQTIIVNSGFEKKLYRPNFNDSYKTIRYCIDWKRGNPYVFRKEDYTMLKASGMLFARKFDEDIDSEIIKMIERSITNNE